MRVGATGQQGESLLKAMFAPFWRGQEAANTTRGRRPARAVPADQEARGLRRLAVRRPAQAAGDGPRADGRPRAGDARRADGRGEPRAQAVAARPRQVAARRGPDRALRRARHGHGARHLRLGDRDGAGTGDRRGPAGRRDGRPARHRRLPRRPPRHRTSTRRSRSGSCPRPTTRSTTAAPGCRRARDRTSTSEQGRPPTSATDERAPTPRPTRGRSGPSTSRRAEGAVLRADDLIAGYLPGVNILNGADLYCQRGELVGIIGPNGAGQVHPAQGALRPGQGRLGHGHPQGRRHHQPARRPPGQPGHRVRPADQQRLPHADHRGEPPDGASTRRPRSSPSASSSSPTSSRRWASAATSAPGRCPAASGRWWRWAGR